MQRNFYRSLDRPMDVFGLKGRWIKTFGFLLGIIALPAALIGASTDIGVFIAVLLAGGGAAFFTCIILQGKTPERRLDKARLASKMERLVVRRENISRIILPCEEWEKAHSKNNRP